MLSLTNRCSNIILSEKKSLNKFDTIEWTSKNSRYKNFEHYPIVLSQWYKFYSTRVSDNDEIVYGIEIVKSNEITEDKKNKIQKTIEGTKCKSVIEISAEWILKQKERPSIIELEKFITADEYIVRNNHHTRVAYL
jgi:hypothetical protein